MSEHQNGLKKDLGFIAGIALVVGMVIGSGIFMKPGKVIAAAGDSTMGLMAWIIGGVITLAGGLTMAELSAQIPRTGGLYAYLDAVFGKAWSYLFGWVETVIYGPATIAALGLYFSALLVPFLDIGNDLKVPVAIGTVLFLTFINALGSKYGGALQTVVTACKLIPIVLIAGFGLIKGNGQVLNMTSGLTETAGMGAAVLATLWAYDGWVAASFVSGEMKNPGKQLPRAIVLGLSIVMAAYVAVNLAILHVLPASEIVSLGQQAAGTAAGFLFGDMGGRLLSIGIIISIFGTLNGYVMAMPRIPYAMAVQGQLPAAATLAKAHPKFGTPVNAIILEVILAILLMTLGDPDRLTDIAMFVIWIFYMSGFVGVIVLRKRTQTAVRSYSVPLYPLVPAVAILGSLYILASTLIANPTDSFYSLLVVATGLPVFLYVSKKQKSLPVEMKTDY